MSTQVSPTPIRRADPRTTQDHGPSQKAGQRASDEVDPVCEDGYRSSGPSPTLHVLGAGKVGRALLRRLTSGRHRLLGLSDRSASLFDRNGLDPARLADHKQRGVRLAEFPGARRLDLAVLASVTPADLVIDCTSTEPAHAERAHAVACSVLRGDASLVLAAKDAVSREPARFLDPSRRHRVGVNAVLGGTGRALQDELPDLRDACDSVTLVANATSTAVIEALELGGSFEEALQSARSRGLLESDPELDLNGTDAALKLAIVATALWNRDVTAREVERDDVRQLDPDRIRDRARRGRTTRLVARASRDGALSVRCESVPRDSTLAVPATQVVYAYELKQGGRRVHVGAGLGPEGTAAAILEDVHALTGNAQEVSR